MKRTLMIGMTALALLVASSACTGEDAARDAIKKSFPDQYSKAVAVAKCESGLNPSAVSPGGSNWGLFQINKVHRPMVESMGYSWSKITDAYVNAKVARKLYNSTGWKAWSCG